MILINFEKMELLTDILYILVEKEISMISIKIINYINTYNNNLLHYSLLILNMTLIKIFLKNNLHFFMKLINTMYDIYI